MTKPLRSPVLGYNHNVRHHGRVFHIQTEDSGPAHPRLYTHLFFEGTILASKKHEYDVESAEDIVRLLMQRLHKSMIKELAQGAHDQRIGAFFAARGQPAVLGDNGAAVVEVPGAAPLPVPAQSSAAIAVASAVAAASAPRPVAASGSIELAPARPVAAEPPPAVTVAAAAAVPSTAAFATSRPPVVMVKPAEVRRPPVVLSSSADGVVVQRNVVINVGGGSAPLTGAGTRAARPRAAVPYVVREGSYSLSSAQLERTPSERTPAAEARRTRTPMAPSDRTPGERAAFGPDLVSDKSLDEVILEYLSDDAETDER